MQKTNAQKIKIFFKNIKPFRGFPCLSGVSEVKQMNLKTLLQWFVRLFQRDMEEYQEDQRQKEKLFQTIREKQKEGEK